MEVSQILVFHGVHLHYNYNNIIIIVVGIARTSIYTIGLKPRGGARWLIIHLEHGNQL